MSKDYKPAPQRASTGSPFFTGLFIGLLLGIGASLAITMYLKGADNPFSDKKVGAPKLDALTEKPPKETENPSLPAETSDATKPDNKFDFYTILPETESTVTEQEIKNTEKAIKKDSYFLQVGAFPDEADADNMKAKLALQGFEAVIQTATIPEKGVWHRVRIGPLSNLDQINKMRGELTTNGFNTDLIKVHTETKPQ